MPSQAVLFQDEFIIRIARICATSGELLNLCPVDNPSA